MILKREKWWVYSFLDWNQGPSAAIWYIAVAALVVTCFFLQVGIHALRDRLARLVTDDERTEEKTVCGDAFDPKGQQQDPRYYSHTLIESGLESHITIHAPSVHKDDEVVP